MSWHLTEYRISEKEDHALVKTWETSSDVREEVQRQYDYLRSLAAENVLMGTGKTHYFHMEER